MKSLALLAALALVLGGSACGQDSTPFSSQGELTVEEALVSGRDGRLTVTGALFVVKGRPARLCSAIAESYPPQCGGASVIVEGLEPSSIPELEVEGDVAWAESVALVGTLEDAVLRLAPAS